MEVCDARPAQWPPSEIVRERATVSFTGQMPVVTFLSPTEGIDEDQHSYTRSISTTISTSPFDRPSTSSTLLPLFSLVFNLSNHHLTSTLIHHLHYHRLTQTSITMRSLE
jgi:hypothetical protein